MDFVFITAGIVLIIGIIFSVIITFRNQEVYAFRMKRLTDLETAYNEGKLSAAEFYKELRYFRCVSYNQMVYMFWKPLDSFERDM